MPSGQKLLHISSAKHKKTFYIVDKKIRFFDFPGKNNMSYAAKHLETLSVSASVTLFKIFEIILTKYLS